MLPKFHFDPFGWIAKILPETLIHVFIQFCAILACGYLVYIRVENYHLYVSKLLWVAETALFLFFGLAYVVRAKPVKRSSGFVEIVVPLIAAFLPMTLVHWPSGLGNFLKNRDSYHLFRILEITPTSEILKYPMVDYMVVAVIIFGYLFACAGIVSLRRSFSITPEARKLVSGGIYRFIRHPVYLGELIASLGVMAVRFNLRNCIIYILMVALQVWRAFMEERKLASAFPEYSEYKTRTGFMLPSFRK